MPAPSTQSQQQSVPVGSISNVVTTQTIPPTPQSAFIISQTEPIVASDKTTPPKVSFHSILNIILVIY